MDKNLKLDDCVKPVKTAEDRISTTTENAVGAREKNVLSSVWIEKRISGFYCVLRMKAFSRI